MEILHSYKCEVTPSLHLNLLSWKGVSEFSSLEHRTPLTPNVYGCGGGEHRFNRCCRLAKMG